MHFGSFPALITYVTHDMQVTGPFNTEILDVLPSTVKFICHNGAGYDNIDIATCTKKGTFGHYIFIASISHSLTACGNINRLNTRYRN